MPSSSLFSRPLLSLAVGLGLITASAQAAPIITAEQSYQLALEARSIRDYPTMLDRLREAALGGEPAAQELLASLLLSGPALYGKAVAADPCEAEHWISQAAAQGSTVARHQRLVLNRLRDAQPALQCPVRR